VRPAPAHPAARSASFFFRGQALHLVALLTLLPVAWALASPRLDAALTPWFAAALGIAVIHQVYVWIGWRAQLGWATFTHWFGRADFTVWNSIFFPLLIGRPVLIATLAVLDAGSLAGPTWLWLWLGSALAVPSVYLAWSIHRYFGFDRAAGGDHFRLELRERPLVREGAFRWTPNGMYVLGFLGLWSIAMLARSHLALVAVLFQHAYIWVHFVTVEQPDMDLIFADQEPPAA
jgi:Phospholipid methyltransferase